jgi:hypothetical protein
VSGIDEQEIAMQLQERLVFSAIDELRVGRPSIDFFRLAALQTQFASDIDVLNYALTLEHLETAFYRLTGNFDLGADPFGNSINEWLVLAGQQEAEHVAVLTQVITQLGGEPVAEADYDFGVTDGPSFVATAAAIENLGVAAYYGAGQFIENAELLTAAGSIAAIEARHAAYLNMITGEIPFPSPYESPMTPDEVLTVAGPFIISS